MSAGGQSAQKAVGVIGDGSWGTTIAHLLAKNGRQALLWGRSEKRTAHINGRRKNPDYVKGRKLHDGVTATNDAALVARACDLIFLAIPSHAVRGFLAEFGGGLDGRHRLISCIKGIEIDTLKRVSEIIREETACLKIGALSGPNLAAEIMDGHPAATTIASKYEEVVLATQDALVSEQMRVYGDADIVGVEVGGALKNIIAIACGLIDGLKFGDNAKSLVMTRGIVEIARLGSKMGAEPETFHGLSGIGDLIATCSSSLSRNHTVGWRLARGEKLDAILADMKMVAEGVKTARAAVQLADRLKADMPIARCVYSLLYENAAVDEIVGYLMKRKPRYEKEGRR